MFNLYYIIQGTAGIVTVVFGTVVTVVIVVAGVVEVEVTGVV